ncbi:chorismate mutase [Dysgonomonas sp. ZJ279]|uniref:chorismate mutase n=1 Tax=Dysgonomonas sp. ZJ279 TaxID=2709796 RepID=UPI0013ECE1C3|nr:chorismate mutase [Dysgonomonas sp. ZJ279]
MESNNITHCTSLDEVRLNIDKIDNALVKLIADRSRYVDQAAQFKKTTNDVVAVDRVSLVINKVKSLAEQHSLDPSIVEKVYRTMIRVFTEEELAKQNPLYSDMKKSYY